MLEIKSFIFGSFGTNTYVVSDAEGNILLIDPACASPYEQQQLFSFLQSRYTSVNKRFSSITVVATHGHLDHLWGAPWVCETFGVPVLIHEADIPMATHMQVQYDLWGIPAKANSFPVRPLAMQPAEGEGWPKINARMEIIATPGHTPGGVCLYFPDENVVFSGDTLFRDGYGRTDLPGGDMSRLVDSLKRLFSLPSGTRVLPGHGDEGVIFYRS